MTPETRKNGRDLLGLFPGNRGFNKKVRNAEVPLVIQGARKKVYALYCRRSTEQENASIERQILRGNAYVYDRYKADVSFYYDDEGVSGETVYRRGLDQMLADAEAGLFNVLVVEAVDRLGRKVGLVTNLYERLIELGIEVHSVTQGAEVGEMDLTINALLAAQHQKLLRQRIGIGKMLAVQKKKIITQMPFGYMRHPYIARQYVVDEELRPTIEWMFEQRANGLMGMELAKGARDMCPKPELFPKHPYAVITLLQNPLYKGLYIFGKTRVRKDERGKAHKSCAPIDTWQWFEVDHLRVVSPELWARANDTIVGRERKPSVSRLLHGKVACATCGQPMRTNGGPGLGRYLCAPRADVTYDPLSLCPMHAVNVGQAQEVVFGFIRQMLMDDELERAFEGQVGVEFDRLKADADVRRRTLEARRKKVGDTLEKAMDNALLQSFPADLVLARQRELAIEWESLGEELKRLPDAKSFPTIDPTFRATLRETLERFEPRLKSADTPFTPEELTVLVELRKLVKELRVYPVAGSRSVKLVATLDLGKAYGQARLPDGLDCAERRYEQVLHRMPAQFSTAIVERSFEAGDHFLTDEEFEALVDRFGGALMAFKEAKLIEVRAMLNFGLFLGSTSSTETKFDQMKIGEDYGLLKSSAAKISKLIGWDPIFQLLEERFPARRGTLNYECWENWVFFRTARHRKAS